MQFLERISRSARAAGVHPLRVRVRDEHSKRDAIRSADTVQRMEAMRYVSEDLLSSLPRLLWCNTTDRTQDNATIAPEARIKRPCAAGLHAL